MSKLKQLLENRADKENAFEALTTLAKGRELTESEVSQLSTLESEIEEVDRQILPLQKIEDRTKKLAAQKSSRGVGAPQDNYSENKELQQYSYAKAFADVHNRKKGRLGEVSGFEAEMLQEAHKEAAEAGIQLEGNIAIPSKLIQIGAKKSVLTVGTEGTDVVQTEYGGLIGSLRIEPIFEKLGVTVLQGLKGNLKWPRSTNDLTLVWETETSDADELTPTFDAIDLSPKRLAGYIDVTLQMLHQSPFVMENFIREKLRYAYESALDTALLAGPTGGNSPVGILNYSGVTVVPIGTNGGAMTYALALSLLTEAQIDNVRDGKSAIVMNPPSFAKLAITPKQSSGVEGNFIINPDSSALFGQPIIVTNRMPANLTKGSGTALSAMIYSPNWSSAIVGTWGGFDILFDPYTQAGKGTVRFVVNTFADVDIEHPEEFVVVKDFATV
jgi:HK97 family phage major capsid protein